MFLEVIRFHINSTFSYTYALVDDDTDSTAGYVENAASGTVVDLVWHTLLDGTITLDVDDISLNPAF